MFVRHSVAPACRRFSGGMVQQTVSSSYHIINSTSRFCFAIHCQRHYDSVEAHLSIKITAEKNKKKLSNTIFIFGFEASFINTNLIMFINSRRCFRSTPQRARIFIHLVNMHRALGHSSNICQWISPFYIWLLWERLALNGSTFSIPDPSMRANELS